MPNDIYTKIGVGMTFDLFIAEFVQSLGGEVGTVWNNILTVFFCIFTFLAEELFLIVVLFSIFWIGNKKLGRVLTLNLFAAISLNGLLKICVARPRPFQNPDFNHLNYYKIDNFFVDTANLESFSFPSGHSQSCGAMLTSLGIFLKKKWVMILCLITILLVMLSRVFLGVHYPSDVIIGGILGIGSAFLVTSFLSKSDKNQYIVFAISIVLLIINFIIESLNGHPSAIETAKIIGVGVGAISGVYLDDKTLNFKTEGKWWKKIIRLLLGLALLLGIKEGLKYVFSLFGSGYVMTIIFAFFRYAIVGIFATYIYPLIFTKLKI